MDAQKIEQVNILMDRVNEYLGQIREDDNGPVAMALTRLNSVVRLVREAVENDAQDEIAHLKNVITIVEWVDGKCPWCDGWNPETYTTGPRLGHSEGCERQTALRGEQ